MNLHFKPTSAARKEAEQKYFGAFLADYDAQQAMTEPAGAGS